MEWRATAAAAAFCFCPEIQQFLVGFNASFRPKGAGDPVREDWFKTQEEEEHVRAQQRQSGVARH